LDHARPPRRIIVGAGAERRHSQIRSGPCQLLAWVDRQVCRYRPALIAPSGPLAAKDDPELDMPVPVPSLDSEITLDRLPDLLAVPAPPIVGELSKEVGKVFEA
jgi:hypothetical protein